MKLRTNLLIAFIIIGLTTSLSSVAFAQNNKKKSKTPSAKASGAKAKTAGLSQGTIDPGVAQKNTNLSGADDPDGNTQRSSKASKSKVKTNGYAEYEEIADQTPKKPAASVKANKATPKANGKPTNNIVTSWDDMEKVKGSIDKNPDNLKTKNTTNVFILDTGAEAKAKKSGEITTQKTTNLSGLDDPDGLKTKTIKTGKMTANKQPQGLSGGDDPDGLQPQTMKVTKKTTDFQTTSEDLQSLKADKLKTNLSGLDDPENTNRSSKALGTTKSKTKNPKFATFPSDLAQKPASNTKVRKAKTTAKPTANTNSRKPKTNGVYEEDEQKTPKKKP